MKSLKKMIACISTIILTVVCMSFVENTYANYPPTAPELSLMTQVDKAGSGTKALADTAGSTTGQLTSDKDIALKVSGCVDPDGDAISYTYAWYKNNVLQPDITTSTVKRELIKKGEVWRCEVTPSDGKTTGPMAAMQVTVVNTPPQFENKYKIINVVGNHPCQFSMKAADYDKDTLTYKDPVLPAGITMNPETRMVTVNAPKNKSAAYSLNFSVSDGQDSNALGVQIVALPAMAGADLSSYVPPVGNQGSLGACTSWAVGYYYKTFQEAREKNWDLSDAAHRFSPTFLFNQVNAGPTVGSSFEDNLKVVQYQGCATLASMPYTMQDYTTLPTTAQYENAMPYRSTTYQWFSASGTDPTLTTLRQHLDSGDAFVIGVSVYEDYLGPTGGNDVNDGPRGGYCIGGHAITVVGYDDNRQYTNSSGQTCYGAFKFVNSWGTSWSGDGYSWLSYNFVSNSDAIQSVYKMTDRIGYVVKGIGYFHVTHPNINELTIYAERGKNGAETFAGLAFEYTGMGTLHGIPSAVDITDGGQAAPSTSYPWKLAVKDNYSGNAGRIDNFKIKFRANEASAWTEYTATDTPVAIVDNTGAFSYSYIVGGTGPSGPLAPTNLTATSPSSTQVKLTWTDTSTNEDGFKIYRKGYSDIDYLQIATVGANVTTYTNTGVVAGYIYKYYVKSYNVTDTSNSSNIATIAPLTAPTSLAGQVLSSTSILLTWNGSANAIGYTVQKSQDAATFTTVATVTANTQYTVTGLTSGTTYYFRVSAWTLDCVSDYSNVAQATTTMVPNAPSNLTGVAVSSSQIDLAWTDNSTNETGFIIEICQLNGSWYDVDVVSANVKTCSEINLAPNTTYFFRVSSLNNAIRSTPSNVVQVTTLSNGSTLQPPSNLAATAVSSTQINLTWNDNSTIETGFAIEISTNGNSWSDKATVAANVTGYNVTGLTASTTYYFQVRALNGTIRSMPSNVVMVTTQALTINAPSNLTATAVSNSQINLTWQDNANNETFFVIEISQDNVSWYDKFNVSANIVSCSVTDLTPNTKYYFRVRAINGVCYSSRSNVASATTLTTITVNPPSNLTAAAVSASQINLAWQDNAANETGFVVEMSLDNVTWSDKSGQLAINATSYNATSLTASTMYYFRVRALNGTTRTAASNVASATTQAAVVTVNPPSNLAATAASSSQINLTWQDNSNNETGFVIEISLNNTTWSDKASVAANVASYNATGLSAGTLYYFRARALNGTTRTAASNVASATTQSSVVTLNPPSNLAATAVSSSQINLTWQDNSTNETGFVVEMSLLGTPWSDKATVAANTAGCSITGLSASTTCYFQVRSLNGTTRSTPSNLAQATTTSGVVVTAPAAPSGLTATAVSSSQINLTWTDNSTNETGFVVEMSLLGTPWSDKATVAANTTGCSITGLSANTTCYFQARSLNGTTRSTPSNLAQATTTSGVVVTAPAAPSTLTATAVSGSQINLTWTDNSTNETGFVVEMSLLGTPWSDKATVAANTAGCSITGLSASTTCYFQIRSLNGTTRSTPSNLAQATTTSGAVVTVPAAPSTLKATAVSTSQIDLTWQDNSTNETGFVVEMSLLGTPWSDKATVAANTAGCSITGLSANTTCYFQVRSVNGTTRSNPSNLAQAITTVAPPAPAAPSNLTATIVSASQINLTWADNSSNETGFVIEVSQLGTPWSDLTTVAANSTSYTVTGLKGKTAYYFQIRSLNGATRSTPAKYAGGTTL